VAASSSGGAGTVFKSAAGEVPATDGLAVITLFAEDLAGEDTAPCANATPGPSADNKRQTKTNIEMAFATADRTDRLDILPSTETDPAHQADGRLYI
jgi:hypothetical protein